MRITAPGGWRGRLAKLAALPAIGFLLAACGEQANVNRTSDAGWPNLFGQGSSGFGFPHEVVTSEGIASAGLYLPVFLVAVTIFILIEGLLLFMVWRFRRRGTDDALPEQVHGNNRLEIIWTAIPAIIVTVLFVGSAVVLTDVEAKVDDPAVVVDVEAYQFGWTFKYMDPASYDPETDSYEATGIVIPFSPSLASSPEAVPGKQEAYLPVDVPVRFRLHSLDVIHSFYVPAFFFKRDVVPGRLNEFEVTIEQPGTYGGQCAEFCGMSHGRMFFTLRAVEQAEYDAWFAAGGTLVTASAADAVGGTDAVGAADAAGDADAGASATDTGDSQDASEEAQAAGTTEVAQSVSLQIATTAEKPIAYTTTSLEARAGETVTLSYRNDSKVPHNVVLFDGPDTTGDEIAEIASITGPDAVAETTFTAPSEPGSYFFHCEFHPLQMTGTLTIVP